MENEELLFKYIGEIIEEYKIFYTGSFEEFIRTKFKNNLGMYRFLNTFHRIYSNSQSPTPRISVITHHTFKYLMSINVLPPIDQALKTAEEYYEPTKD